MYKLWHQIQGHMAHPQHRQLPPANKKFVSFGFNFKGGRMPEYIEELWFGTPLEFAGSIGLGSN